MAKINKIILLIVCIFMVSAMMGYKPVETKGQKMLSVIAKEQDAINKYIAVNKLVDCKQEVLWLEYYKAKKDLHEISNSGDVVKIVCKTLKTAELARLLNRADILSWQYNNIAKEIWNEHERTPIGKRIEIYELLDYGLKCAKLANEIEDKLSGNVEKKATLKRNLKCLIKAVKGLKPKGEQDGK